MAKNTAAKVKKSGSADYTLVEKNIYARAGGASYQVRLCLHGKKTSVLFDSLEDAQTYKNQMRANVSCDALEQQIHAERAERTVNKDLTLAAAIDKYIATVPDDKASKYEEQCRCNKIKRSKVADLSVYSVSSMDILNLLDEVGGSSENKRHYALVLSRVYKYCRTRISKKITNPVDDIDMPKKNKPRERRLSPDEYDLVRTNIPPEILAVVIVALETAARKTEIITAKKKDLNIDKKILLLPKTKNGMQRILPLSSRAIAVLQSFINKSDGELIFDGINASKIRYEWQKMRDATGLHDLHFHDLRHEATSRLFEKGLNVIEAASVTGHQDLKMLKRYTHLNPTDIAAKLG